MDEAKNITPADVAKMKRLFGLEISADGVIPGLTDHAEFAFFVAMHITGEMTARLKVTPRDAVDGLRHIADLIEFEGMLEE